MRSRLVLLLAAAVVFAPGWAGGAPGARDARPSDLARVLAPTFDEARSDRSTKQASTKEFDRGKTRSLWHNNVVGLAEARGFQPPPLVLLAALLGLIAAATLRSRLFHSQRAPPLQTV